MLSISKRFSLAIACMAALAWSVVAVASAAAAPASFNVPANSGVSTALNGTLTITEGLTSTSCTFNQAWSTAGNNKAMEGVIQAQHTLTKATCANGGTFSTTFLAAATKNGTSFYVGNVLTGSSAPGYTPFMGTNLSYALPWTVPFVNGSGSTQSKFTFSNTPIGKTVQGATLTATGSLSIRRQDNVLLLLS